MMALVVTMHPNADKYQTTVTNEALEKRNEWNVEGLMKVLKRL